MANCDYYNPIFHNDKVPKIVDNCCNCNHWNGDGCNQKDKVLNRKTALVHEPVYNVRRGVCGVLR